ncbi:hypothetical protein BDR04DRAFT_1085423 [Suillus decipiens]|nr:hypothetical protein BDR04DRAFT_1062958 [Suillus decipiens]KAG2063130.1 hypothetical protein BDR04DRAFT_1085423 [Suillus decipiens]
MTIAIVDSAVSYFIDRLLSSRVSRFTYGTQCSVPFNPFDVEHRAREKKIFRNASCRTGAPNQIG